MCVWKGLGNWDYCRRRKKMTMFIFEGKIENIDLPCMNLAMP